MVLMSWKPSLSLLFLELLMPLNQCGEKGITVLAVKGKLGCCYATGLRGLYWD